MRRLAMVLVAAVAATSVWAGSATANRGSRGATPARPMLVALEPGVEITPLINSGDHVGDAFQYTGVPDGIGIYQSAPDRLEVFTNHELSYRYGDPAWSRVSHLTLDADGAVVSASYAVDGTERYEYFCSSTLDDPRRRALVLHGRGVVRVAARRHVDRDQHAHRARSSRPRSSGR